MNTDKHRLKTTNLSWHYPRSSEFICGQIAFFSNEYGHARTGPVWSNLFPEVDSTFPPMDAFGGVL
jgi:hypothetical protein